MKRTPIARARLGMRGNSVRCLIIGTAALLAIGSGLQAWAVTRPQASFSWSPQAPVAGQPVQFTDTSAGTPKSWAWVFGDGATSTVRNPVHTYGAAGKYQVALTVKNAAGRSSLTRELTVSSAGGGPVPFNGNIVLGSPTATSVKVKVYSPDQAGSAYIGYRPSSVSSEMLTDPVVQLATGTPLELALEGLLPDTTYYYHLYFQATGASSFSAGAEYSFHTARAAGQLFRFTIQADPHLDGSSDLTLYRRTLANVLADMPDFHVDLGDTFMTEKYSTPLTSTQQRAPDAATVNSRYVYERGNFGLMAHSVPLFLVNGNHDGELGWLNDGTAQNLAVWATQARLRYFGNPFPDSFFTGDSTAYPVVGQRAAWYAWRWGDALFVVLDPFWNSRTQAGKDPWNLTLGKAQYDWLVSTLASSPASYKFVFIHNLVGGLDGQMRGGVEAAPYFEWGGKNADGTNGFAQKRPGWAAPIHDLLRQYGVTAVFHGHDHLYARQVLDGIVYMEVPQPSAVSYSSGPKLASDYHYTSGVILSSSGHLRITVGPGGVTGEYVRAWLPANETSQRKNGQVDDTWTVPPR